MHKGRVGWGTNSYKALGQYQKHCQVAAIEISSTNYINYGERIINLIALTVGVIVPQGATQTPSTSTVTHVDALSYSLMGLELAHSFRGNRNRRHDQQVALCTCQASFIPRVPYGLAVAAA